MTQNSRNLSVSDSTLLLLIIPNWQQGQRLSWSVCERQSGSNEDADEDHGDAGDDAPEGCGSLVS